MRCIFCKDKIPLKPCTAGSLSGPLDGKVDPIQVCLPWLRIFRSLEDVGVGMQDLPSGHAFDEKGRLE